MENYLRRLVIAVIRFAKEETKKIKNNTISMQRVYILKRKKLHSHLHDMT